MEEENIEMDWDAVSYYCNHWQQGSSQMKSELLRVVKLAVENSIKDVEAAMGNYVHLLDVASYDEPSFQHALKGVLQEHVSLMANMALSNPYMDLTHGYSLDCLAERFVQANMSSTEPDVALMWLKGVDASNERLRVLISSLFHSEVKRQLQLLKNGGYAAICKEDTSGPINNADYGTGSVTSIIVQDNTQEIQTHADPKAEQGEPDARFKLVERRKPARKALMQKLHGFPLSVPPLVNTHRRIHQFLVDKGLINDNAVSIADIAALFSEDGPAQPIVLQKKPGKLIHIIRWLVEEEILAQFRIDPKHLNFSKKELKQFGYWLMPRFIGTFRDSNGREFTTKALSNEANRLPHDRLKETKWYKELDAALRSAVFDE
ncbi:hypothetical protein ACSX1A_03115 [Pontibacter sp. MBLB2868]|uniref:hypothetical protein n=1 Tax=Pontibacter sp. MBLB2868 TaxID=3451555 RepID=UPI003F74FD13